MGIKFTGIHCWANIDDGLLGNEHSWIPEVRAGGSGPHFVGVVFAEPKNIAGFRISRKGAGSCCDDSISGSYAVQYTLASDADHETPDSSWTNLGTFSRSTYGFEYFSFCREIRAAAVRIVVTDSRGEGVFLCIDELEIYEAAGPTSSLSSASASSFSGQNVAARGLGSVPFGSSSKDSHCSSSAGGTGIKFTGIHCWANINDGLLGNEQ